MLIKIAMIIGIILLVLTTLMMAMIVGYVLYRVLDALAEERKTKIIIDTLLRAGMMEWYT